MSPALRPWAATRRHHHHGARRTMLRRPHAGGLRTPSADSSHRSRAGIPGKIFIAAQRPFSRTTALRLQSHTLSTQGERRCKEQPLRRRCNTRPSAQPRNRYQRRDRSQQRKSGRTCQRRSSKLCNERSPAPAAVLSPGCLAVPKARRRMMTMSGRGARPHSKAE